MSEPEALEGGRLARNVMHFGRALRSAGLPIGPGRTLEALRAVEAVGLERRADLYWTLFAVFVHRRDQAELFDQCFHLFWRDPKLLERMQSLLLPQIESDEPPALEEVSRRVGEAFQPERRPGQGEPPEEEPEIEVDASLTFSDKEILAGKDFEDMSAAELAEAARIIKRLTLPIMEVRTRRYRPAQAGSAIDLRRTLRRSLRQGGDLLLERRQRRMRHPPLVVLCDISGSMSRYSRMFLLFMHALTSDRDRVSCFLFGTRLTNVTRYLKDRDIDKALDRIGEVVQDWAGGTRIGHAIATFNRDWSRRVLGQGALVLLITDGLDRDGGAGLSAQMERLHKSCRRLVWLNPLLRWDGYEPISTGAAAMIRHVDDFRTIHNLESLQDLADLIGREQPRKADGMMAWRPVDRSAELEGD